MEQLQYLCLLPAVLAVLQRPCPPTAAEAQGHAGRPAVHAEAQSPDDAEWA